MGKAAGLTAGVALCVVAALLVIGGVSTLFDGTEGVGVVFVFLVAGLAAQAGVRILRRSRRHVADDQSANSYRTYPGGSAYHDTTGDGQAPSSPVGGQHPQPGLRRVDCSVRYRQAFCQFPFVRSAVAVALLASIIVAMVHIPNIGGNGLQGFLYVLPAFPAFYLIGVALFLPYRIRIRDGVLTVGVVGVPRVGRLWRSLTVDLGDVTGWNITAQPHMHWPDRATRAANRRRAGRATNPNNLRGPGGGWFLSVEAAAPDVRGDAYPEWIMHGYTVQSTAGMVSGTGPVLIRTRRPKALRSALQRALPTP